jgi:hypothetical protein
MGYSVRFLPELRLGLVRLVGALNGTGLRLALAALFRDASWRPAFSAFCDMRGLRVLDLLPEDMRGLAQDSARLRKRVGPGRMAVLVRDEQDAMMVKLVVLRGRGDPRRELRAFRMVRDAAAWLGVPVASLEPARAASPGAPRAPLLAEAT